MYQEAIHQSHRHAHHRYRNGMICPHRSRSRSLPRRMCRTRQIRHRRSVSRLRHPRGGCISASRICSVMLSGRCRILPPSSATVRPLCSIMTEVPAPTRPARERSRQRPLYCPVWSGYWARRMWWRNKNATAVRFPKATELLAELSQKTIPARDFSVARPLTARAISDIIYRLAQTDAKIKTGTKKGYSPPWQT